VDAIGELEDKLVGNLIPDSWFKAILDGRGLPDWLAISILADIVYWYRPSETTKHDKRVARKKFKWDWLQFNRGHAAQKFGVSEDAISAALSRLDKLRAIQRDYLKSRRPKGKKLGAYDSGGLTSKMWLLPDGELVPISEQHYTWLKANPDICRKFGLALSRVPDDDTAIRLAALRRGFVRINYTRDGTLTVEANTRFWDKRAQDTIFMLVADNLDEIYSMQVRALNNNGSIVRQGYAQLFNYDDRDKLNHLPLISESRRGRALRRIFKKHFC